MVYITTVCELWEVECLGLGLFPNPKEEWGLSMWWPTVDEIWGWQSCHNISICSNIAIWCSAIQFNTLIL